jgi:hypothetical protein
VLQPPGASADGGDGKSVTGSEFLYFRHRDEIWTGEEEFDGVETEGSGGGKCLWQRRAEDKWPGGGFWDLAECEGGFHRY